MNTADNGGSRPPHKFNPAKYAGFKVPAGVLTHVDNDGQNWLVVPLGPDLIEVGYAVTEMLAYLEKHDMLLPPGA